MGMPGRKYSAGSEYRYVFNGKEKDNSIGEGNLDFGERMYDNRLGRWLSLDPLQKKYPGESHYVFVSNNPLFYKDADGREKVVTITTLNKDGSKSVLKMVDKNYFYYHTAKSTFSTAYQDRDHKESIALNYTIDNRAESTIITYNSYAYDINTNYTLAERTGDWLKGFFKDPPRKYGWTMTGGGDGVSPQAQLEWDSNLPKAQYSESIGNITGLLDAASAWREFSPLTKDGDEFKHELMQFTERDDVRQFLEMTDNWVDAFTTLKSSITTNSAFTSSNVPDSSAVHCLACKGNFVKNPNGTASPDTSLNQAKDTVVNHE